MIVQTAVYHLYTHGKIARHYTAVDTQVFADLGNRMAIPAHSVNFKIQHKFGMISVHFSSVWYANEMSVFKGLGVYPRAFLNLCTLDAIFSAVVTTDYN